MGAGDQAAMLIQNYTNATNSGMVGAGMLPGTLDLKGTGLSGALGGRSSVVAPPLQETLPSVRPGFISPAVLFVFSR